MGKEDVTIILPCLNEEKTLLKCVKQIKSVLNKNKCNYKILVCDNGSTDKSIEICQKNNIEYLVENKKGYGNALLAGIKAAKTKYIVMLDCDLSYDVKSIPRFITELKNGYDVIIGNRFKGKIEENSIPRNRVYRKKG
jgi:glycosyltransferase involved in cell wall biosynthesis